MNDPTLLPAFTQIAVGVYHSTVLPSMDFETYSEAGFRICQRTGKVTGVTPQGKGGLPVVGTPNYAAHPSTEVLCLYYDLKDGRGRRGWVPGTPEPTDLIEHIRRGGLIEAFNSTFEFWIWNMVCVRMYNWPPLQLSQLRCVMARARRHSMPGSLANCSKVLGTPLKDKEGGRLIQKLTRPHTPTKGRPAIRWTPITAWDDFLAFYGYCDRDVETEDHAAAHLPDLTDYEFAQWQTDQTINVRGVQVDTEALDACLYILDEATKKYTLELCQITQGAVGGASEVAKMIAWLGIRGVVTYDLQSDTVEAMLGWDTLPPDVRRVLEIRDMLSSANVKKLKTLRLQVSSDGRLRNQYMYCGADRTGRASAGGVQMQNITSKGPKTKKCQVCDRIVGKDCADCPECMDNQQIACKDWTVEAVEYALADIVRRDLPELERVWGNPIALLCGCLRGLFIAAQGKTLICVDFSAVEAVVQACLARCQWRIEIFSGHGKIYEASASKTTGIPLEEILDYKRIHGMDHPARKKIGKVRELAGGYGGWINAWINFGADKFMTEAEIKDDVLKLRAESPDIVEMWGGQFRQTGQRMSEGHAELYGLEGAVVAAILSPGQQFDYIDISYFVNNDVLYCRLPSGRFLHYHRPRLHDEPGKYGKPSTYKITFEGWNSNTVKGPRGWHRLETYGGRLFENVVQAVAADIQFEALGRLEANNYPIVMHTHDEGSAEVPLDFGSVDEMAAIMTERPPWASWWPLRGAGWTHKRYQKD